MKTIQNKSSEKSKSESGSESGSESEGGSEGGSLSDKSEPSPKKKIELKPKENY